MRRITSTVPFVSGNANGLRVPVQHQVLFPDTQLLRPVADRHACHPKGFFGAGPISVIRVRSQPPVPSKIVESSVPSGGQGEWHRREFFRGWASSSRTSRGVQSTVSAVLPWPGYGGAVDQRGRGRGEVDQTFLRAPSRTTENMRRTRHPTLEKRPNRPVSPAKKAARASPGPRKCGNFLSACARGRSELL